MCRAFFILETQINQLVYQLYDLTEEEINIVEASSKLALATRKIALNFSIKSGSFQLISLF